MTTQHLTVRRMRSQAGFTIVELLIAMGIMMVVTGGVFTLLNPSQGIFETQPEASDVQQRLRVAVDSLQKDIVMAGAGTYMGSSAGALTNFFAPVMPFRIGEINSDQARGVYYRPDAISVLYVPPSPAQTTLRAGMPMSSSELKVDAMLNCGTSKKEALCGFEDGMRVIIFDPTGAFDWMTITHVQDAALHMQHNRDKLTNAYGTDAAITQVATHTYYLQSDDASSTWQLRHYDGDQVDLPVLDDIVKLEFQYFGEPQPPRLLPNVCLNDECRVGPWTTYGPKPPVLGVDRAGDAWPAGENCLFQVVDGAHQPRLPVLGDGVAQVELTGDMFQDGPWCPDDARTERWDADLLRIRRVRINARVQVSKPYLRGTDQMLFSKPGTSSGGYRIVPDQEIRFDVTPRNMNLGR